MWRSSAGRRRWCTPTTPRRGAARRSCAAGRPLPEADRLAWTLLFLAVNRILTGSPRLFTLARSGLRTLFAQRAGEVSRRGDLAADAGDLDGIR
jgi:hypothetical protein